MPYLFGDDDRALRRLDLLARVFAPSTRALIEAQRERRPLRRKAVVLDLGCGPGRTTRLLADLLERPVTGIDNSRPLLWEARRLGPERVRFREIDVTGETLGGKPADLVFARFLLSHLADPRARVSAWGRSLRRGGTLLVEEVEAIDTAHPTFVRYLELVELALGGAGSELYVGPRLARIESQDGLTTAQSEVRIHPVLDAEAAGMFRLNLPAIAATDSVSKAVEAREIDSLQESLDEIAYTPTGDSSITWKLRGIAWDRAA